jgi:fructose-bisphosphate aldolase class II
MNMKELLAVTDKENFAIPAFNICSFAMFNGIMDISEKKNAPVIIEIHPDELAHVGVDAVAGMISRAAGSSVPTVIHLDHGASFADVMTAIRAGFTSVMIDGSSLPFEENVAICQKVVEAAHGAGNHSLYANSKYAGEVSVEGELGNIGTTDAGKAFTQVIHYTQPDEAVKFILETGIDTLAIAIGTCHGLYPKGYKPELKLDILKDIRKAIKDAGLDTKLVLHGGSNNPDAEIETASKTGISKINISSDIKVAFYQKMREVLKDENLREPGAIEPACIAAMQAVAARKFDLFGATGKADRY